MLLYMVTLSTKLWWQSWPQNSIFLFYHAYNPFHMNSDMWQSVTIIYCTSMVLSCFLPLVKGGSRTSAQYRIRQIIWGGKLSWFLWILLTTNVLPLKIFLEYQCRPLTTQSMLPPCLINNEQSVEMLHGTCYHFFNSYYISISWISLFIITNQLFSNHRIQQNFWIGKLLQLDCKMGIHRKTFAVAYLWELKGIT